jgi:hypothetical protein
VKPPFRYPDEDWRAIEACLTKLPMAPHAAADARSHLECIVNIYLMMAARSDPRSPAAIARKACWTKVAEHALALNAALEELETLEGLEVLLNIEFAGNSTVIAGILERRHADYLVWKSQCAKWAHRATEKVKSFRKSSSGNRARGDYVDGLLASLLGFWARHGGRVGKGLRSPSTRFVAAAASGFLKEIAPAVKMPGAILDFVRVRWGPLNEDYQNI